MTEVLISLGLKLNTNKTTGPQPVVTGSLKVDKWAWLRCRQSDTTLQKHLLMIHSFGIEYPNSGSLITALSVYHERLNMAKNIQSTYALISIAVDIAYTSPRVFPVCAAIVSILLSRLADNATRIDIIKKIYHKLSQLPNTGHMEIWLQRISHPYEPRLDYQERLCQVVKEKPTEIWNNEWISSQSLKAAINPIRIVNRDKLNKLKPTIPPKEISIFDY